MLTLDYPGIVDDLDLLSRQMERIARRMQSTNDQRAVERGRELSGAASQVEQWAGEIREEMTC